ncbi:diaminopimelate epimerase [Pedobacter sp.]|uniref:diaminopimelate epimerase n=1 Tax=Pedobacter sp. TaxID=1411316 RepID=UPI003D7F7543
MLNSPEKRLLPLPFFKYQGAGNDFILVDNRQKNLEQLTEKTIKKLCNRRFGIGADGLMLLKDHPDYDFEMLYYNADGKPGSMCGNGGRCIVAFAKYLGIITNETEFLAVDGAHFARISADGTQVDLQMIDVDLIENDFDAFVLNTGSPHYVKQVTGLETMNVYESGRAIRYNDTYKNTGINVNFVEDQGDHLFVRTYERGVEEETFACGTGVTAVALAMARHNNHIGQQSTAIKVLGGNLRIDFSYDGERFKNIFLSGPAIQVFKGEIPL